MATPGLFHELKLLRRSNGGSRGMQDQDARRRRVVQVLPGQLDFLQLAENLVTEGLNGVVVAGLAGCAPNWRYNCFQVSRCGARRAKVR